jgi:hypothetical protein
LHQNYQFQAWLAGREINLDASQKIDDTDISQEQKQLLDKALAGARERKLKERVNRGGSSNKD